MGKKIKHPCFICNKHIYIVHEHHIKKRPEIKKELLLKGTSEYCTIYLCPNCHSYIHKILYHKITEIEDYKLLSILGETDEMRNNIIKLKKLIGEYYELD